MSCAASKGSRYGNCLRAVRPGHNVLTRQRRSLTLEEALVQYRKAANQGNADAHCALGAMHAQGQGVPKAIARALSWYRIAAQEEKDAQVRVAELKAIQLPATMASKQCANCGALKALCGADLKLCARYIASICCGKECQTKH